MNKKTFEFKSEISKLFNLDKEFDVQVRVAGVADTLFCVANENAGKKFDVVFFESDYLKYSKGVIGALKRACAEYSLLLIENKNFDHVKNKSFFNFSGEIVIVVGSEDLISITSHYASIQNKETYAVLTEPSAEYLLLNNLSFDTFACVTFGYCWCWLTVLQFTYHADLLYSSERESISMS